MGDGTYILLFVNVNFPKLVRYDGFIIGRCGKTSLFSSYAHVRFPDFVSHLTHILSTSHAILKRFRVSRIPSWTDILSEIVSSAVFEGYVADVKVGEHIVRLGFWDAS